LSIGYPRQPSSHYSLAGQPWQELWQVLTVLDGERIVAMEHIAALLLVIGCSNNLTECRELPVPVSVFETAADCTAERPFALGDLQGRAQRIVAKCLAVDPALEDDYDEIVWKMRPDGTLDASVEISNLVVASNNSRPEKDYLGQQ
jgi:hypothetical protein